jgi:hypothetical protein
MAEAQARKLMRGRNAPDCQKIEQIIAYYDHLLANNDRRVSKNPVGFLYRAVETPYRFTVPDDFVASPVKGQAVGSERLRSGNTGVGRGRPELKVFSSGNRASSPTRRASSASRDRKEPISDAEAARAAAQLGSAGVEAVRIAVERRMSFLKSVLQREHYEEALKNCTREELVKAAKQ